VARAGPIEVIRATRRPGSANGPESRSGHPAAGRSYLLVGEPCVFLPLEGDATEGCYQRLLALGSEDQLNALPRAFDGQCLRGELLHHLGHRGAVLGRQCHEQGSAHDPVNLGHPLDVVGQAVVVHEAALLDPVPSNDVEVAIIDQFGTMDWLPSLVYRLQALWTLSSGMASLMCPFTEDRDSLQNTDTP
jgi:hypothetical protein